MIHAQNAKSEIMLFQDVTNATATGYIDTRGWDYLTLDLTIETVGATSSILQALFLSESDTTSFVATDKIVAFTGGAATSTSVGFVWPTQADTSNPQLVKFSVDLRARKRYIELSVMGNATAATYMHGLGTLSRGKVSPNTAAEAGADVWVRG